MAVNPHMQILVRQLGAIDAVRAVLRLHQHDLQGLRQELELQRLAHHGAGGRRCLQPIEAIEAALDLLPGDRHELGAARELASDLDTSTGPTPNLN